MVPPFCTFSLHLAALRDLAFLSAASVFKYQLKYDGGHFYTIYSLLLHHHAAGGGRGPRPRPRPLSCFLPRSSSPPPTTSPTPPASVAAALLAAWSYLYLYR